VAHRELRPLHDAAPALPGDNGRRKESSDRTRALPRARIERLLSRRDIPLRQKTLWRMPYETAARAGEILALNIEDLDLEQRRAPVRSKGGDAEFVYWDTVQLTRTRLIGGALLGVYAVVPRRR
jgi:integrase